MAQNVILSGLSQIFNADVLASMQGPVSSIEIVDGGNAYSNGTNIIFTRDPNDPIITPDAAATILTDPNGVIVDANIASYGLYSIAPSLSVAGNTGTGADLISVIDADSFYMFVGRSQPFINDPTPDSVNTSINGTFYAPYQQMMMGEKLGPNTFTMMVPLNRWTANTVYAKYDDQDPDLSSEAFYVVNSSGVVYKCLNNAQGMPSTVQPTVNTSEAFPPVLSDGYQWMYLYTLPPTQPYSTTSMIPVYQEANTSINAVDGAIYSINVQSSGSNYPTSNGVIVSTGANGAGSIYLSAQPSPYVNYYQGCYLTVWGAGGIVNNFAILSSVSAGQHQQITVAGSFTANQINAGYQYQIGPAVQVLGDGTGFSAYATVANTNGGISDIIILNPGSGYHFATALIQTPSVFGANASLRAIISPIGGHGSNIASELFSNTIGITAIFSNTDSNFSLGEANTTFAYRSAGILKNPTFYQNTTPYTSISFNQRVSMTFVAGGGNFFQVGETLQGSSEKGIVVVAAANASTLTADVTGWKGNIQVGEVLTGLSSGVKLTLNNITGAPNLELYSGEIIYLSQFTPIVHNPASPSDTIHVLLSS